MQEPFDRGKLLSPEDIDKQGEFGRYRDVDGDGVPQRTIPGNRHPKAAYFTRRLGSRRTGPLLGGDEKDYKETLDRLRRKHDTARGFVPKPWVESQPDVNTGVICFGSSHEAVREARDRLRAAGVETNHLLLRALPLTAEVREFMASHEVVYLMEQNRDGQMAAIFKDEYPEFATRIVSVLIYDGLPRLVG